MFDATKKIKVIKALAILSVPIILYFLISPNIEKSIALNEHLILHWMKSSQYSHEDFFLPLVALIAGLISSISPCILSLLPLNLSYIGILEARSKQKVLLNAASFSLGIMVVLCTLGLTSAWLGSFLINLKGPLYLVVGILSILMGLFTGQLFLFPQFNILKIAGKKYSPFVIGIAFALSTTPCASPALVAILGLATASGNPFLAFITMASYTFGYVFILFLASLLTGLVKQMLEFKHNASLVAWLSSSFLVLIGLFYIALGMSWFLE